MPILLKQQQEKHNSYLLNVGNDPCRFSKFLLQHSAIVWMLWANTREHIQLYLANCSPTISGNSVFVAIIVRNIYKIMNTFFERFNNIVANSLERFKIALEISRKNYGKALYIAFSGGKDSVCLYGLARLVAEQLGESLSDVATFHYNITNLDPPELVSFVKKEYVDVELIQPKETIWHMIENHSIPPTRLVRYCCQNLKEVKVKDAVLVTGVRWQESARRKDRRGIYEYLKTNSRDVLKTDNTEERREIENCMKFNQIIINPIVDWMEDDVWFFIKQQNLKYCDLYNKGYRRLGCIGCPMAGAKQRQKQFEQYPKYKEQFIRTFNKMIERHPKSTWKSGEECFNWWVSA